MGRHVHHEERIKEHRKDKGEGSDRGREGEKSMTESDRRHQHHHHNRNHDRHHSSGSYTGTSRRHHRDRGQEHRDKHQDKDTSSRSRHRHKHRSRTDSHESSPNKRPRVGEKHPPVDVGAAVSTIPSFKGNEVTGIKRDEWMLPPSQRSGTDDSGRASPNFEVDFFSSLGRVKEQPERLQEKAKASTDAATGKLRPSEREINLQFKAGKALDEYDTPAPGTISEAKEFGSPGYQWRMMKLRRVHERATNEGRPLEDVALEQYNGLAAFEQAQAEQRWLQNGKGTSLHNSLPSSEGATTGIMLHDMPSSARTNRPSNGLQRPGPFRKPGSSSLLSSRTSTPVLSPAPVALQREQSSSSQASSQDHPQAHTPIPSVLDPIAVSTSASGQQPGEKFSRISPTELNKLRAKVMKAEMMKKPDAVKLRAEYDAACIASEPAGANEGGDKGDGFFSLNRQGHMQEVNENEDHPDQMTELRVLPTLDGQGRLYDVGPPNVSQEGGQSLPGNRRKKAKDLLPVRDPKTGEIVSYSTKEGNETLADLVRAEMFTGGPDEGADAMLARSIARDQAFRADAEYMDDNVDRLAARREKSALFKRNFAIEDFSRVKKALDECPFCLNAEGESDSITPRWERASPISSGTRAYLSLPLREGLAPIHVLIAPIDHTLSLLELDDDCWDEMKNFMKCLIQLAHTRKEKMVFYETVMNLRWHKHTYLECVGIPQDLADDLPAYFREELSITGNEWSQHRKIIPFTPTRPMRKSLVPNLPYFAVLFDYRGTSGMGHIIEAPDVDRDVDNNNEEQKDGVMGLERGAFPSNFAAQLLGTLLDCEPRLWRRPRKLDLAARKTRLDQFARLWSPFDWTKMLDQAS